MALSDLQLSAALKFTFEKTVSGWGAIAQGENQVSANLAGISLTTFNQAYAAVLTIASSASTTVDLRSFTNLAGESVVLAKVLGMVVKVSGATGVLKIQPGASNGLDGWFFGSTDGVLVKNGETLVHTGAATATGVTVDATHKTIKFENTGAASIDATVVIFGGT